jgi:prepilin peptidase CpaA
MNLIVGAPLWLVAFLALALTAAAVEDATRLRISNMTCLAVIATALIAMALHGFPASLWQNLLVFAAILALGTAAFAARVLGGGDVKFLAALGLWVDFSGAAWLVAAVLIAGGVLALALLVSRALRRGGEDAQSSKMIPYGLAITAGSLIVFGTQLNTPVPQSYAERMRAQWHLPTHGARGPEGLRSREAR